MLALEWIHSFEKSWFPWWLLQR